MSLFVKERFSFGETVLIVVQGVETELEELMPQRIVFIQSDSCFVPLQISALRMPGPLQSVDERNLEFRGQEALSLCSDVTIGSEIFLTKETGPRKARASPNTNATSPPNSDDA